MNGRGLDPFRADIDRILQISWNPSADMDNNQFEIDGNACNPWAISSPAKGGSPGLLFWSVQVTAPLPLEAISDLFNPSANSPLLPSINPRKNKVSVTPKFFQSNPNGISSDSVKSDALGFFSLVVSYAKAAPNQETPRYVSQSPKTTTSIMPRTEFVTLYAQVKSAISGTGSLYELVKILACYKNDGDDVEYVAWILFYLVYLTTLAGLTRSFVVAMLAAQHQIQTWII